MSGLSAALTTLRRPIWPPFTCRRPLPSSSFRCRHNSSKWRRERPNSLLSSMTKELEIKDEGFPRHMRRRQPVEDVVSPTVAFQVVGNGEAGGTRSLLLYTSRTRYMFNTPEGCQRLVTEQCPPHSLTQLSALFFTGMKRRHLGGLPGMALSAGACGAPDLRIVGPSGCAVFLEASRQFLSFNEFSVIPHNTDEPFEDVTVKIESLEFKSRGPAVTPTKSRYSLWKRERRGALSPNDPRTNGEASSTRDILAVDSSRPIEQLCMAFLITIKGLASRLQMDKCLSAGIPPGPLVQELREGREVVLDDGRVVRPEDVMAEESATQKCLVLDCPDEHFLDPIFENRALRELRSSVNLTYVFHFTPKKVVDLAEYAKWMGETAENGTTHVLLCDDDGQRPFSSSDVFDYTEKLRTMAPLLFPRVGDLHRSQDRRLRRGAGVDAIGGQRFHVRPQTGSDDTEAVRPDVEATATELASIEGAQDVIEAVRARMLSDASCPEYPRVTFLGTGSSVPQKYRNVSSILLETAPDNFILLDCGEGTLLQLHRNRGDVGAKRVLENLKAVYVSHLHADHHLGLASVLQARRQVVDTDKDNSRLAVIAPGRYATYLNYYDSSLEPLLSDLQQVKCEHLLWSAPKGSKKKSQQIFPQILRDLLSHCGLRQLVTCRAYHSPQSFCLSLITADDYKLVYTGDTRPIPALIELGCLFGRPPDLLIHEATMEHEMLDAAKVKKHSTFTEAVRSAKSMGAKFTLLTHFSQRYSKLPMLDEFRSEENVAPAFDHMTVTPRTLRCVREMYPALEKVFPAELALMSSRQEKRGQTAAEAIEMSLRRGW